jgi:hypothetical protein
LEKRLSEEAAIYGAAIDTTKPEQEHAAETKPATGKTRSQTGPPPSLADVSDEDVVRELDKLDAARGKRRSA